MSWLPNDRSRRFAQVATTIASLMMTCLALVPSTHGKDAGRAARHRTTLSVSGDRADAARGFLLKELHDMTNIEIVDERDTSLVRPSAFDISVQTLELKTQSGQATGIAFSAVVVGPFNNIEKHVLRTVPARDGVRAMCEEFAAEFGGYVREWEQVKVP